MALLNTANSGYPLSNSHCSAASLECIADDNASSSRYPLFIKKSLKPTQQNPEGGIVEHEAPIDASNVAFYDEKGKTAVKLGSKVTDKGKKVRVNKKTGKEIKEAKK